MQSWSIDRVAEWLLARDYEQYVGTYCYIKDKGKFYEINDMADAYDLATNKLLKRIIDVGYIKVASEDDEYLYNSYYNIDHLNNNCILRRLGLDFYRASDFAYNIDFRGYVKGNSINQLGTDDSNFPELKSETANQFISEYRKIISDYKSITDDLENEIEEKQEEINALKHQLNNQLTSQGQEKNKAAPLADKPNNRFRVGTPSIQSLPPDSDQVADIKRQLADAQEGNVKKQARIEELERLLEQKTSSQSASGPENNNWCELDEHTYPPELHLSLIAWQRIYKDNAIENQHVDSHSGKFKVIAGQLGLDPESTLGRRVGMICTPYRSKKSQPSLVKQLRAIESINSFE